MPMLSVIVPVYQVEKYLPQCIESVLAQTFTDLELILVDDGSPDGSGKICDDYAQRHANIRVIHKSNGGHTSARKAGLGTAEGKYISFIDSDDFLEPDMYERMIRKAQVHQADMVISGHILEYPNRSECCQNGFPSGVYSGTALEEIRGNALFDLPSRRPGITGTLWCKLFRRDMILDEFLNQEEDLRVGEDTLFSCRMVMNAGCVVIDNENQGYHYRVWENSITQAYNPKYFHDINLQYDRLRPVQSGSKSVTAMESLACHYIFLYVDGVYRLLGRGNQAGIREKCEKLQLLAGESRLQESLKNVDIKRLPEKVGRTAKLLGEGKTNRFLVYHVASAVVSKVIRMVK